MFDHLLGDELRRAVRAQRGPRPRAFQAYYQKGGGGVVWSVRLAAVGITAVTLTAGAAAYAAAAGTGRADPLNLAAGIRWTVDTLGQQRAWGLGTAPTGGSGAQGAGQPAPSPQLEKPLPVQNTPLGQLTTQGAHPSPSGAGSSTRSRQDSHASPNPSPSGDGGNRHRKQPGG